LRKILSILLVLLFTFNAGGYYFVYLQLLNNFKLTAENEGFEQLSLNNLELIKINNTLKYSTDEFEKINDEEISYNGRMYDIFMEVNKGNYTYYHCFHDSFEDILQNSFAEYLSEQQDDDSNLAVKSIIKILITQALTPRVFRYTNYDLPSQISLKHISNLNCPIQDIPSPPPKTVS
jgi:hypothetical protein